MKLNQTLSSLLLGAAIMGAPLSARTARQAAHPTPAAEQKAPAAEHQTPAAEHPTPGTASAAPAAGHEAPKPEGHQAATAEEHGAAPHGEGQGGAHHQVIKLFGMELGDGAQALVKLINFAIFAGGLFFLLKGALTAAFKGRAKDIEERLAQAAKDQAEGEAQLKLLEERMAGLQGELDGILAKADADADAEKARIIEAARAEAAVILAQAQTDIASSQRTAEAQLRALVAELAVEGATRRLQTQIQGGTAATVIDRAIQQVGTSSGGLQ